jgi:CheY-like chemotaxis protein
LSRYPVETVIATSVPDAISLFNFARPDLVITDLEMPLGGGKEVLRYIRSGGSDAPVYYLSGGLELDPQERLAASGVFQKPIDVERLWCSIAAGATDGPHKPVV